LDQSSTISPIAKTSTPSATFAGPFPVEIISRMLGIPVEDRQRGFGTGPTVSCTERSALPSTATKRLPIDARVCDLTSTSWSPEKRQRPADDMLSRLCSAEVARRGRRDPRLLMMWRSRLRHVAGRGRGRDSDQAGGQRHCALARNPPSGRMFSPTKDRLPAAVEEILRYWPPSQYQGRFSMRERTFWRHHHPGRSAHPLLTAAATRDERAFADPGPIQR